MRAIIINPFDKTITETDVDGSDGSAYKAIVAAVFPKERFPDGDDAAFTSVDVDGANSLYLDDIGLMRDWDKQAFFAWGEHRLAGNGIVLGYDDEGNSTACTLPLDVVQRDVKWLDARDVRVPAPSYTTFVDGKPVVESLDGRTEWNYGDNPGRAR